MFPPWLITLVALVHTGQAFLVFGSPAQVPLSTAPKNPGPIRGEQQPSASRSKSAITPEISAYAEGLLKEKQVPGLSVGVVRVDGDSIVTEFGAWGNVTEDGNATKPETLFSIGSCSKAFLVSAVGILMDDFAHGRNVTALPPTVSEFTWDTKVRDLLLEDWAVADVWATEKANVRDILTHVSGLTRHDMSWLNDDSPPYLIQRMRYMKHKYELREKWSYNNLMYITASHLVSLYSGKPFTAFVKERIFDPLNMTTTTYRWDEAEESQLFSQAWSGSEHRRIPYWFSGEKVSDFIAGAGGVISSATDMTKWLAMLLNGGVNPYTNHTVLPRSVFDEMTSAHSIVIAQPVKPSTSITGYGMGWMRTSLLGHDVISHGGGLPGFLTDVTFLPEHGLGVATFANSDGPHYAQVEVPLRIIQDYLDLDHTIDVPQYSRPDDSLLAHSFPHSSRQTPRCDAETFSMVPIEQYAGIYYNPGYENFTLCAVTTGHDTCRRILSDWAAVTDGELDPELLYGETKHVLFSHLTMQRVCSGDGYDSLVLSPASLFPSGYGQDDTPFAYRGLSPPEGVEVECDIWSPGFVVGCGVMNSEEGPRGTGETIRDRADVWFLKIWDMW
ncbi:beta-lactamase/transpeptidase-like protein [Lentinus tigrinus ALCF2SS1-7]|uniref:Beta-lactamase/transpeptidase-like protein n=1 Tax=Lentinus tigrinus ALCF2SS1-6 TaxID=1328759 RepID=A0A5C2SBC7_9APHY|nr:beta-lactamase/transpeptidase-like protein [Lentinus tigrinus ALCF2SS1-6]RPD72756.1 beta-lactamase/transpeptidase-like protein [Lentinus tigrinus ALCF2SS1-7]